MAELLRQLYGVGPDDIPVKRIKSQWRDDNKCGFLLGILQHGREEDRANILAKLLTAEPLQELDTLVDRFYNTYIVVFKQHTGSRCSTPTAISPAENSNLLSNSRPGSSSGNSRDPTHFQFKMALEDRDERCLFCWDPRKCQAAHIVGQKKLPIEYEQDSLLARCGLESIHQVQNGLWLCKKCHGDFDDLEWYVESDRGYVYNAVDVKF
jgi:ribosomal protein L37AE/L43A